MNNLDDDNNNNFPLIKANGYFSPLKQKTTSPQYVSRKLILKKYYGRKIIFVDRKTHFTAAINRCKYFLRLKLDKERIYPESFKALANLVIFNMQIIVKSHKTGMYLRWTCYPNIHPIQLKKALRSCRNPNPQSPQPKHLQQLFHLKSLNLQVTDETFMRKASKIIRKLRFLQSLSLKYLFDYEKRDWSVPFEPYVWDSHEKKGWRFFYQISKLRKLQRLSLETSLRTLQAQPSAIQQDFIEFFFTSHKFKIHTEIYTSSNLDFKELTAKNLLSILKSADSLSVHMGVSTPSNKNRYACQDEDGAKLSEEENKKILKQGERPVKLNVLYREKLQVNIGCLLSLCKNLVSLYLKASGEEAVWSQNYESFPEKLQTMVLDVDFLGLTYEILKETGPSRFHTEEEVYELPRQRKVKFHSGLVQLLKQLKTRAAALETFTVFMCLASFKKSWYRPKAFQELFKKAIEKKAKEFFKELESFEKLHRIDVCKNAGYVDDSLNRVLTAKSLKTIHVRSCETT